MRMPYQCLAKCGNILLATRGSRIDSFSLENGALLSTWSCPSTQENLNGKVADGAAIKKITSQNSESSSVDITLDVSSPPAKRRKLSSSEAADVKPGSKEGKKKQNNRSDAVASGLEAPAVIALTVTRDTRHVIAVTGEDKSIRVFENFIEEGGKQELKQISKRGMPKRPCAISISSDDTTIISADKFGDIYSLPLIPSETFEPKPATPTPEPTTSKPFTPAANELTIHSQRNRKALENQKRQTNRPSEKTEPSFEHKILLGHVSMLTDLALVTSGGRNYIITADRDEHIRVSRGIPQTHVIEGFCLGHTEFISRLCVPSHRPELLISGGGDDELFVWEWEAGRLVSKVDLKSHVVSMMRESDGWRESEESVAAVKLAVSGVYHTRQTLNGQAQDLVIVICERIPALFVFVLASQNTLEHSQTVSLPGNALAVVTDIPTKQSSNRIIVSIDTIHKPGSTTVRRESIREVVTPLQSFVIMDGKLGESRDLVIDESQENNGTVAETGAIGKLLNLLYGLENLRKREGDDNKDE